MAQQQQDPWAVVRSTPPASTQAAQAPPDDPWAVVSSKAPKSGILSKIESALKPVQRGLDWMGDTIRNAPVPQTSLAPIAPYLNEMAGGMFNMLAHPIDNAPAIGATAATMGYGGPILGAMARAGAGALAGTGARAGYNRATDGPDQDVSLGPMIGEAAFEGVMRGPAKAGQWAKSLQTKALTPFAKLEDLRTRRFVDGTPIPTLQGSSGPVPAAALEDMADQSLREGVGTLGSRRPVERMELATSRDRAQKTALQSQMPDFKRSQVTEPLERLIQSITESSPTAAKDVTRMQEITREFFDRPVPLRDELGNIVKNADGVPETVRIDGDTFTVPQGDLLAQELGDRISRAKAFGTETPKIDIETFKALRRGLKQNTTTPEIDALDLAMSRRIPLSQTYANALIDRTPAVGLGELGVAGNSPKAAMLATTRRPRVLSNVARGLHNVSRVGAGAKPDQLSNLIRLLRESMSEEDRRPVPSHIVGGR